MNILKKLYDKSKIWFAVGWIIAYCVLMSVGDGLSAAVGIEKSITLVIGILLSAMLLLFLKKNGLFEEYGLCAPKASARSMLYYAPIIVMLTANLWYGVTLNYGGLETVLYILTMLCVGLLEEVIFRGLLFNAISVFANESAASDEMRILTAILLTVITGSYAAYLALSVRKSTPQSSEPTDLEDIR